MNVLWKIAWRNLREHKTKTLIIGLLVAFGVSLMVIGNSVLESITQGLEASFIDNYTGDLIIRNTHDEPVAFIGAFGAAPPAIGSYTDVLGTLENTADVNAYTPLLSGIASLNQDDETLSIAMLWGIQPSSYFAMFPNKFSLNAGRLLEDGETGIMLSQTIVDEVQIEHDIILNVGDTVLVSGRNDITGTKIRELPIVGIGEYENAAGILDLISLVDASTLRALTGLTAVQVDAASTSEPVDTSEDALFGGNGNNDANSEDALFGSSFVREADTSTDETIDFDNILGDTSVRDQFLALDNNAWHFLLVDTNLREGGLEQQLSTLNTASLEVETWRWGAGILADLAFNLQTVLNIIIVVIVIVAVIIIMNTLVISVTERLAEIGTIRAIGGQKGFVRSMIMSEVLTITALFGLVGIAVGSATIGLLNAVGVPASNFFLQVLFGGSTLRPLLSINSLWLSLVGIVVVGVVASLYPTSVALGVSPVQAMQKR
ncbi:MAG: FtsX-like permease family protein [Deinococcota bacterium]